MPDGRGGRLHRHKRLCALRNAKLQAVSCLSGAMRVMYSHSWSLRLQAKQADAYTGTQGTPGLMYGPAVDLWSAGVVLFILLGGYPPFYDENEPALFAQIRKGQFSFDDPVWDSVSERSEKTFH